MLHRTTLCALVALSSAASAQCLDWTRPFAPPGIVDNPPQLGGAGIVEAVVVDDTSGPATLILGGNFYGADELVSPHTVRWDGTSYRALAGMETPVLGLWRIDLGAGPVIYAGTHDPFAATLYQLAGDAWVPVGGPPRAVKDLVAFDSGHGLELHAVAGAQWGGGIAGYVYRLSPTGWVQLAGGLDRHPESLAVFDDGNGPALYAAGAFQWQWFGAGPMARSIARWSNGTWIEVGGGLTRSNFDPASAFDLAVHDSGAGPRLVVGGLFENAGNQNIPNVAAWDGSAWSAAVPGLVGPVHKVASATLPSGPKLVVSGLFYTVNGAPAYPPIVVDGAGGVVALGTAFETPPYVANVRAFAAHDDGHGPSLFFGGDFTRAGTSAAANVVRWDEASFHPLSSADGVGGYVQALERHDDGSGPAIYAGGEVTAFGGIAHTDVARFDGSTWTTVGPQASQPFSHMRLYDLHSTDVGDGRRLYAGGQYTRIGGIDARAIAVWDGTSWSTLAGGELAGIAPTVYALTTFDDGTGPALYVGGGFDHAGPVQNANNIARWTPTGGWSAVGSGLFQHQHVSALATFDDGSGRRLYAIVRDRLFRLDNGTWTEIPGAPPYPAGLWALGAYEFGAERLLFVGGRFESVDGVTTYNLAAWNGASWRTFGAGATGFGSSGVTSFHLYDDGQGGLPKLAAGGYFSAIGGTTGCFSVGVWDGVAWRSPAGGGVNGAVSALASFDDGDGPSLFAGGGFTTTDTSIAVGFARYGWVDDPSCSPRTGSSFCDGSGSGAACPCGNAGQALHGCGNSANANGARLRARGAANATDDTVTLELSGTTPNAPALYFQGTSAIANGAGSVFGDGVRCAGGSVRRLGVRQSVAGTSSFGAAAGTALISDAGAVAGAATRYYQCWYRDPNPGFCTSSTFNLSNGVEIHWAP